MDYEFDDKELRSTRRRGWLVGIVMFAALILMTITFVWAVVRLDPLIQDFVPGAEPPTAAPTELAE